jgi:hypothetical protein
LDVESGVRYVALPESWMTFEARSTLHTILGKTAALTGYAQVAWDANGMLAAEPAPKMHVEFAAEALSSGNNMQDREMWKVVDSKRFPRVAADLRDLQPARVAGRYAAAGDVTLAGRTRRYDGEFAIVRNGNRISIEGDLKVDIRDFGLKPPSLLLIKVDPVVNVHLHLVAESV